jgi:hypothetical protein
MVLGMQAVSGEYILKSLRDALDVMRGKSSPQRNLIEAMTVQIFFFKSQRIKDAYFQDSISHP